MLLEPLNFSQHCIAVEGVVALFDRLEFHNPSL